MTSFAYDWRNIRRLGIYARITGFNHRLNNSIIKLIVNPTNLRNAKRVRHQ